MVQLVEGDIVAGKYRIERVLAQRSGAQVFAARHLVLDQLVAIKVPRADVSPQSPAAERFRHEARAAARLQSAHACRVLDIGTHLDCAYMVMEYLDGQPLSHELERRGRLPWHEAFEHVLQACDAVSEAHAAGILHRDIKPANLFLAALPDGSRHIKVLGFGVSKTLNPGSEPAFTLSSTLAQTPVYMSPEQLDAARDLDERTDIWALGVILYELISGRPPFSGATLPQLVSSVLTTPPRPLSQQSVGTPAGLDTVIGRALQKNRDQRYGSIAELLGALLQFAPDLASTLDAPNTTQHSRAVVSQQRRQSAANSGTREASGISHRYTGDPKPNGRESSGRINLLTAANQQPAKPAAPQATSIPGTKPLDPRSTRSDGKRYGAAALVLLLFVGLGLAVYQWTHATHATHATQQETTKSAIEHSAPTPAAPSPTSDPIPTPTPARPGASLAPSEPPTRDAAKPAVQPASEAPAPRIQSRKSPAKPSAAPGRNEAQPEPAPPKNDPWSDFGGRR